MADISSDQVKMSAVTEHIHVIPSLELYPRVCYFDRRYKDLLDKFRRVTGRYKKIFENEELLESDNIFENGIEVRVFGENDLTPTDFIPAAPQMYTVKTTASDGKENACHVDYIVANDPVKNKAKVYGLSKKGESVEYADDIISVGHTSFTIVVSYTNIQHLDDAGLQEVTDQFNSVLDKTNVPLHACFLLCRPDFKYTNTEEDTIRQQIASNLGDIIQHNHVIIRTDNVSIKSEISLALERECVERFVRMKYVLQEYSRDPRRHNFTQSVLETETVARQIQDFLHTAFGGTSESIDFDQKFALVIKCIGVKALSKKYNLPVWLCNGLLDVNDFQKKLFDSFSKNTRYRLKTLRTIAECPNSDYKDIPFDTILTIFSNRVVGNLQRELRSVFDEVEKPLSQFSSAVRKMLLEIISCLKKSTFGISQIVGDRKEQVTCMLDLGLRKDILRINGVYGIGTIYGQLEIHVNSGVNSKVIESEIKKLMRTFNKVCSFTVRHVETKPEVFVDSQFENGEHIESLSPLRKGTLGGFLNGSDNQLYGLTCAHVVRGPDDQEHNVFVKDSRNGTRLFAISIPNLTVSTGENAKPLIDIAAVRIVDHMQEKCVKFLKDDGGKIRPAILAADTPIDLAGTYVYKHGAMSGLTKGLICCDDYSILCDDESEVDYIMLIDNYDDNLEDEFAVPEDELAIPGDEFAIPGDSGSTICTPDENEVDIIKTVGILSAGRFKPAGYDTPLYFSFRLYDGLRKLTAKAGGIQFNFPQYCI